jgi:alkyl sulfatase BDS1-like metallo-beta-lactamase superfamily hydrolase
LIFGYFFFVFFNFQFFHRIFDFLDSLKIYCLSLSQHIPQVNIPPHLTQFQYLKPIYDEPEFIIRNIWRRYGGWYDGNPARLKPPTDKDLSKVVCEIGGGVGNVSDAALKYAEKGGESDLRIARQLAEWAYTAAPTDEKAKDTRKRVYEGSHEKATSLMARAIYHAAVNEVEVGVSKL